MSLHNLSTILLLTCYPPLRQKGKCGFQPQTPHTIFSTRQNASRKGAYHAKALARTFVGALIKRLKTGRWGRWRGACAGQGLGVAVFNTKTRKGGRVMTPPPVSLCRVSFLFFTEKPLFAGFSAPFQASRMLPSGETMYTSRGMSFPLARRAFFTMASRPPQQGTCILATVMLLMSLLRNISASFSE